VASVVVSTRLSKEMADLAGLCARHEDRKLSEVSRSLFEEYVAERVAAHLNGSNGGQPTHGIDNDSSTTKTTSS
jgi:hypothetical protein